MDFKVKDMSYGTLISHTFPGFLLGCQLTIPFILFAPPDFINIIYSNLFKLDYTLLIFFIILSFIISTILGSILDAIHNLLFWKYDKRSTENDVEIIKKLTIDQLEIYKVFLENDPWYAFESYANIGISLTPGIIFLPCWLYRLGFTPIFIIILFLIYVLTIIILFVAANIYCKEADMIENALIERFSRGCTEKKVDS
jgi:hypothetical protein